MSSFWPRRLRGQLTLSYLLVILISIGGMATIIHLAAAPRLDSVGRLIDRRQAYLLAPLLADHFRRHGAWVETPALLQSLDQARPPALLEGLSPPFSWQPAISRSLQPERVLLLEPGFTVIADSTGQLNRGESMPASWQVNAAPVTLDGQLVGRVVVTSELDKELTAFVQTTVRRIAGGAVLLTGGLALLVSLALARHLGRPVQTLSRAAMRLAGGDSLAPLPVQADNEIGDLTQAFNEMAAALATQQQLRRQLVADIAHELRTPLSIMKLNVAGLADALHSPAEAAAALEVEIESLAALIEDLRALSLAESGGVQLELEAIDLRNFLRRVGQSWRPQAEAHNLELQLELSSDLPPLSADPRRLEQVLDNLLSNALRYTPAGGRLTLGAQSAGSEARLWVADTGPGLPAGELPRLFERFYRADPSRSRESGGSGLGLAIAKQLVLLHGGRIWAESEPGQGMIFWVGLPVRGDLEKG
ncbi:MAG TPA: ATP-binding protein [Anaerolineae bacterium]|nr:ATP-binding protein [Anaerolineae bacterium]